MVVVSVACGSGSSPSGSSPATNPRPASLAGTAWTLVTIQGRQPPVGSAVTIAFEPERISGESGCNSYGGGYTYDPATGAVRIGDLISTKRACVEPARNELEAVFFQAMRGVAAASVDPDGRLVLSGSGAELVLAPLQKSGGSPGALAVDRSGEPGGLG
jgi:heat shock protein HslJ